MFEHGLIEHASRAKAHAAQGFVKRLIVEFAHAVEGHGGDGRTLFDVDDDHIAFDVHRHITEKAGGVQALNSLASLGFGELLTDLDRHVAEDSTGFHTLNAIDADIPYHEGRKRLRQVWQHCRCDQPWQQAAGKWEAFGIRHA